MSEPKNGAYEPNHGAKKMVEEDKWERVKGTLKGECKQVGQHQHPVHMSTRVHGSIWVCLHCKTQIMGNKIEAITLQGLIDFAIFMHERNKTKGAKNGSKSRGGNKSGPEDDFPEEI